MKITNKRMITWSIVAVVVFAIAVVVQAAIPSISLNSPVSFPVDI